MTIQNGDINASKAFKDDAVSKVTIIKTDTLTLDVYYYKPGQAIGYHRHPTGDQIFTVLEGTGTFKMDDGSGKSVV